MQFTSSKSRYKVRAYCSSRGCSYVQPHDVVEAINHESSVALSMSLNDARIKPSCPQCGESMQFYPFASITDALYME